MTITPKQIRATHDFFETECEMRAGAGAEYEKAARDAWDAFTALVEAREHEAAERAKLASDVQAALANAPSRPMDDEELDRLAGAIYDAAPIFVEKSEPTTETSRTYTRVKYPIEWSEVKRDAANGDRFCVGAVAQAQRQARAAARAMSAKFPNMMD